MPLTLKSVTYVTKLHSNCDTEPLTSQKNTFLNIFLQGCYCQYTLHLIILFLLHFNHLLSSNSFVMVSNALKNEQKTSQSAKKILRKPEELLIKK